VRQKIRKFGGMPGLSFNAALLVPFARRAKRSVKLPMRTEGDETLSLFASATAKTFLDRARQVVILMCPRGLCGRAGT